MHQCVATPLSLHTKKTKSSGKRSVSSWASIAIRGSGHGLAPQDTYGAERAILNTASKQTNKQNNTWVCHSSGPQYYTMHIIVKVGPNKKVIMWVLI